MKNRNPSGPPATTDSHNTFYFHYYYLPGDTRICIIIIILYYIYRVPPARVNLSVGQSVGARNSYCT